MFYVLRPQSPYTLVPVDVNPEDAYVERKRREYLAALQEQQERHAYEHAVAAEEERHRDRLATLAQQERIRRYPAYRRSLPPHAVGCARPSCAPTSIIRGRYNRQREAPHFRPCAPAPVHQPPRPQCEELTLDRLFAELFGHSAHDEPEGVARKTTEPAAVPQPQRTNPTPVPVASTSTAPAPAPPAASAPAEPTEGHWFDAVKRTQSVAAIYQVLRTFESLRRAFTFPAGPLAPVPGSEAPRLAYNPTNAPVHAYEHALSELLTRLDAVESFGFRGVRERRKEVVVQIEQELEALEKKVAEAIAAGASPVVKPTEVLPEEPATENQAGVEGNVGDKVAEDVVMEEFEVAAALSSGDAEETAQGYDLDTVPAPAPVPVEPALTADSPMVDSDAQTVTLGVAQPEAGAIVTPAAPVEPFPTQPKEDATGAQSPGVDSDPMIIITEPASRVLESVNPGEVVPVPSEATATPIPEPQNILADATASSSESESEIDDAVDVTVSSDSDSDSDSDVEVTVEADDVTSDAEKDFEML